MRSISLPTPHQLQRDPVPFSSARVTSHLPEAESRFSFSQIPSTDFEAGTPFLTSFRTDIAGRFGLGFHSVAEMRVSGQTFGPEVVTVRAAVFKLLRFHLHDWLAIIGLAILDGVLNIIQPFRRYVGLSMIGDFMYPLKRNTIPFQAVPVIALVIPLVFFVGFFLFKKDIVDLHHAILGLFFSVLITAVITDAVKDAVGRPRPDFFWRCFPDGKPLYNNFTQEVLCHGDPHVIKEGHKSFPSGHTSWSFAGLGFLSLYLAGKIQIFDRRGHVAKLTIVFLPLLGALLVGLSRVDDYWHHWQDVFAGALLGLTLALLCYHQFFPLLHAIDCMGPHSHPLLDLLGTGRYINRRSAPGDWPPGNGPRRDSEGNREDEIPL